MQPDPKELGTRERRRLRLRDTIRNEAFKLFAKQGYDQTTVEEIAEAADISYSTFFRHFPSKDAVAFDLRFDGLFIAALETRPATTSLSAAMQDSIAQAIAALTPEALATLREQYAILLTIPALQASTFLGLNNSAHEIGAIITNRIQKSTTSLEIQAFSWALVGGWIASFHFWIDNPDSNLGDILKKSALQLEAAAAQLEEK